MGLTIKRVKSFHDIYKVYALSEYRSEPLIGTLQLSLRDNGTAWLFIPTLGVHSFHADELSGIATLLRDLGRGEKVHASPPEQDYTVFVPRDPYDVD